LSQHGNVIPGVGTRAFYEVKILSLQIIDASSALTHYAKQKRNRRHRHRHRHLVSGANGLPLQAATELLLSCARSHGVAAKLLM
jgi:hypothetical protein